MTKTIKDIIETAIRGGWRYNFMGEEYSVLSIKPDTRPPCVALFQDDGIDYGITKEQAVLDKNFWQALGKELGWDDEVYMAPDGSNSVLWRDNMHQMLDHLIDGGDIEEYLIGLLP